MDEETIDSTTSGTQEPDPVNSPTTKEDEGDADDAVTSDATSTNPKTDDPDA